jgi:hypothetical protein
MEFLMPVACKRAFPPNTVNSYVAEPFLAMLSLFEIGCPPQADVEIPKYILNWRQI